MALICIPYLLVITVSLQFSGIIGENVSFSVPPECADDTICFKEPSDHVNYPQNKIDDFLLNNPELRNTDYDEEALDKLKHERYDEINCSTRVQFERAYSIKGENDRWYPVVQSKFFTQRIKHVTCASEGVECMRKVFPPRDNYQFRCETQKGRIELYVYDDHKKDVVLMNADVNCCCKCILRKFPKTGY